MTFRDYLLTVLAQVGGGIGGPADELLYFALAAAGWLTLLGMVIVRRWRERPGREQLLLTGFGLAFLHDATRFTIASLAFSGRISLPAVNPFYNPLEHALAMTAVVVILAGLLRYALDEYPLSGRYLKIGLIVTAGIYLPTAVLRALNRGSGTQVPWVLGWSDWIFHLGTVILVVTAIVIAWRRRRWLRGMLTAAFSLYLLDDLLMLVDKVAGGLLTEAVGPVRHLLHLATIPMFAYIYLKEMEVEREEAILGLRTALEQAAAERNRSLAVVAAIGDGLMMVDANYRVVFQNNAHRALKGECLGEHCYQVNEGNHEVCAGCAVAQAFADGRVHRAERVIQADGRTVYREVTASPLFTPDGSPLLGIELVRDVTERRLGEEALRLANETLERQNEELQALDRMKDGLLRDVSHELKTPVAKQAMQLEMLRRVLAPLDDAGEVSSMLRVLERSVTRQQRVIRNILDLARLEGGRGHYRRGTFRLNELVEETMRDQMELLGEAEVAVTLDLVEATVNSDREMLSIVLTNLVENAVKYRRRDAPSRLAVGLSREGDVAVVSVADNGIGMNCDELGRAFDRFFQADASAEGSGLGLAIARRIIEDLGGAVAMRSEGPGLGCTVEIRLPGASEAGG